MNAKIVKKISMLFKIPLAELGSAKENITFVFAKAMNIKLTIKQINCMDKDRSHRRQWKYASVDSFL